MTNDKTPKPAMVRVYRADDPSRTVILVPASEVVPPSAPGMPDYRMADCPPEQLPRTST